MKFYSLAALSIGVSHVAADKSNIAGVLAGICEDKNLNQAGRDLCDEMKANHASTSSSADGPEAGNRSLAGTWADSMVRSIDGYACWCYFENDHGKGKGPAQNAVDHQCKILHDGYTCMLMDADDENEECVPWLEPYNTPWGLGWWANTGDDAGTKEALQKRCAKKNKTNCAIRACIVEGYFSINLFKLLTSGVKYDTNLLHSKGKFDPKDQCAVVRKPDDVEKRCCGVYPIRAPYKHVDDRRECCGERTYNAEFLQCCAGDEIKVSCF